MAAAENMLFLIPVEHYQGREVRRTQRQADAAEKTEKREGYKEEIPFASK